MLVMRAISAAEAFASPEFRLGRRVIVVRFGQQVEKSTGETIPWANYFRFKWQEEVPRRPRQGGDDCSFVGIVTFILVAVCDDDFRRGIVGQMFVGEEGGGTVTDPLKVTENLLPICWAVWLALSVMLCGECFVPVWQVAFCNSD